MELRQLEYFQLVSRLNNFTRAAEHFYVTQPTITLAIQKLEHELGVQLFDRSQKQFSLTPEGQIFLQRVNMTLDNLKDAVLELQDYLSLQKGSIKIGVPPMVGSYFLPSILADFQRQYPAIELIAIEAGSMRIREQLEQGELDVGIVVISQSTPKLSTLPLATGEISLCLSPNHPLCDVPAIAFEQLHEQSFVLIAEGTYVRHIITNEFKHHGFTPRVIFSSGQLETLLRLVKNEIGVTFLIDFIARQHTDIVVRPLTNPLYIEIGLAWKKEKYLSRASQAFIDFMSHSIQANANTKNKAE